MFQKNCDRIEIDIEKGTDGAGQPTSLQKFSDFHRKSLDHR